MFLVNWIEGNLRKKTEYFMKIETKFKRWKHHIHSIDALGLARGNWNCVSSMLRLNGNQFVHSFVACIYRDDEKPSCRWRTVRRLWATFEFETAERWLGLVRGSRFVVHNYKFPESFYTGQMTWALRIDAIRSVESDQQFPNETVATH